jgi:mono/diheme cytochrome c family protein
LTLAVTFRTLLVAINVAAVLVIIGVIAYKVLSIRREPQEKSPPNLTPFYDDETLEDSHLTRVLRWALVFSTIIAVVLPLYWLLEPQRQDELTAGFAHREIERGEVLYSNSSMPEYDAARSLACANCHGTDGGGGSANFVITPDAQGNPDAAPRQVTWRAPALNTVLSRMSEEQVIQVITFGRPGTPMAAWGLEGGGPKNTQSVTDIVAYLRSIQKSPKQAQQAVTADVEALQEEAAGWVAAAEDELAQAQQDLADAKYPKQRAKARLDIAAAERAIAQSRIAADQIASASEGELLFMTQCARCHTKGWSYFDPTNGYAPDPEPQGGGAFGPSLRGGSVIEQFPGEPIDDPDTPGFQSQIEWVAQGAEANKGYGVRGISSGRMPHFGVILTPKQIEAIVRYERNL